MTRQPVKVTPCLTCGACCAFFRASFYHAEADDITPGGVPVDLTEDLNQFRRVMKGTNQKHPRCIALTGEIGREACCSIYARRSTVCRDFPASYVDGVTRNPDCDRARALHGLPPVRPEDWHPAPPDPQTDPDRPIPRPRRDRAA